MTLYSAALLLLAADMALALEISQAERTEALAVLAEEANMLEQEERGIRLAHHQHKEAPEEQALHQPQITVLAEVVAQAA